jgi:SAM-dependent methyltransferase
MLKEHLDYIADVVRLESFQAAVARSVFPNSIVADLGCGSGVLGLLCLQAGAGHVYAVDESAMLEVARETLTRAGYGDRVTFIHGRAGQIELPERVEMVICDHVGYFGFDYGLIELLGDARRRFLKPGGCLIPTRLRLQLAPVSSPVCNTLAHGWQGERVPLEFHWLHDRAVNTKHSVELKQEDLIGSPVALSDIDLAVDQPDFFSWRAELRIERDGVLHGVAGWFECHLAGDAWMTNSPLADRRINRPQAFLPTGEAMPVRAGDAVHATVMARPAEQQIAWTLDLPASGKQFRHSTWQGLSLSTEQMIRANPEHVPNLSPEGRARLTVLGYCDGKRSAREIAEAVVRDHPQLFPTRDEIVHFVARVLGRDCR